MKISGLELFHISIPFARPYRLSKVYGTIENAHAVIIKLHTDAGIIGLGEADPLNPFTEETPGTVMAVLRDIAAPHLLGENPARIAAIEQRLDDVMHGNPLAHGAVDMALFDIIGKFHQLPAHAFLGGMLYDHLPLLGPIGSGTPSEDADAIEALSEQGYRTVMIKMGAQPIAEEIKRMRAAAERFGDRMTIITDANQGWQFKEALQFIEGIGRFAPFMMEQPVPRSDIYAMKKLRERAPCLLSADESLVTADDAAVLIRHRAADAFSIKVSKNGGLSKSLAIARTAATFGMGCLMNSMLEFGITQAASLQLGCTLKNLLNCGHAYMSLLRMSDDITDFGNNISNAVVTVPDGPGLGVTVDEQKLQKYTRDYLKIEK